MRFFFSLLPGAALLALCGAPLQADPHGAQDIAYRMASSYVAQGFSLAPADKSGTLKSGQSVRFLFSVTKGLDYVFLIGGDEAAQDIDVYIYDEVGNLILDDRRTSKYAGVQFHSSYTGSVVVYVHMVKAEGAGSYSVLVGRRAKDESAAIPAPAPANPSNNGSSPPAPNSEKKP